MALNNGEEPQTVTVSTFHGEGAAFEPLLPDDGQSLSTDAEGHLQLTVPALGVALYRAIDPVPASDAAPGIAIVQPRAGETVTLMLDTRDGQPYTQPLEVRAELDRALPAEVTFAARVDDGPYRIVGTDDNPPYRVFYRVSDTPEDASLTFKAVVDDLSGHLNPATVENVGFTKERPEVELLHHNVVIHYIRADGNYGDPASADFNDYSGLHLWGEAIAPGEAPEWSEPRRFAEQDACGVYTVVALRDDTKPVNFIVHRGDAKDGTDQDRSFHPREDGPETWLKQDDATIYTEPPEGCPRVLGAATE